MTTTNGNGKRRRKGGFSSVLTSAAGIAGSIATIATAAATVFGLLWNHQATQLQHANAQASTKAQQVSAQQQQIQRLQRQNQQLKSALASPSPTTSASSGPNAPLSGMAHYLSNESATVDNSNVQTGQQVIAAKSYPNTIMWGCGNSTTPNEAYDVAGSGVFTAEVGIPDNMQGATDVIATVTFSNESGQQIGKPVQVSLGHPVSERMNIKGVTQLGMACVGRDRQTSQPAYGFSVALGNAGVS